VVFPPKAPAYPAYRLPAGRQGRQAAGRDPSLKEKSFEN